MVDISLTMVVEKYSHNKLYRKQKYTMKLLIGTNKLIKSSLLSSDSTEIFDNLKSFEDYTINIFQK